MNIWHLNEFQRKLGNNAHGKGEKPAYVCRVSFYISQTYKLFQMLDNFVEHITELILHLKHSSPSSPEKKLKWHCHDFGQT